MLSVFFRFSIWAQEAGIGQIAGIKENNDGPGGYFTVTQGVVAEKSWRWVALFGGGEMYVTVDIDGRSHVSNIYIYFKVCIHQIGCVAHAVNKLF